MTNAYDALLFNAGQRFAGGTGLDPGAFAALLKAHMAAESNGDPHAIGPESHIVSRGLMQITIPTAQRLGYFGPWGDDTTRTGGLYDPAVAIPLAGELVRANLLGAGGDIDVAIAAYNEGLGRALADRSSGGQWRTTDPHYVSKVRGLWTEYAADFADAPPEAGNGAASAGFALTPGWIALLLAGVAALLTYGVKRLGGHS